nr:MAG TPA: hypothetical protein [Caudoviricetes sp.]
MVSRRKLRQQTERNSQTAQSALANFKPAAPATPSYPNVGTKVMAQPQGLSLKERDEWRTKLNNTNSKQLIQDTNAKFRGQGGNPQPSRFTGSFNNAFAAARQKGLQQFEWNGKLYGTQVAASEPTYNGGSLPQVHVTAKRVSTTPIPAPVQPAQNTSSADNLGWGGNQGPYRSAGTVAPTRGFDNRGAYSTTGGSFTNTIASNPSYETSPQTRRYTPSFRFPGVESNKKGGKLEDKQQEFVAYLIQASGIENEDELNDYIQDLGQDGLKREFEKFEELMTQGTEQVPAAAKGAKLNYIKSLRGQCPDGFEMQYFKKGGVMCSQCIKKAQAQKATTKAEKGTKVVQDFKADMKKCGGKMKGKMKKKEDGGKVKTIPGVLDTKENKLSPKGKVQIKKHYFGGKL